MRHLPTIIQQNRTLNFLKTIFSLCLITAVSAVASAQQSEIQLTGKVIDELSGSPVPFATVCAYFKNNPKTFYRNYNKRKRKFQSAN